MISSDVVATTTDTLGTADGLAEDSVTCGPTVECRKLPNDGDVEDRSKHETLVVPVLFPLYLFFTQTIDSFRIASLCVNR